MYLNCLGHKNSMKGIIVLFVILILFLTLLYQKCISINPVERDRQFKYNTISGKNKALLELRGSLLTTEK